MPTALHAPGPLVGPDAGPSHPPEAPRCAVRRWPRQHSLLELVHDAIHRPYRDGAAGRRIMGNNSDHHSRVGGRMRHGAVTGHGEQPATSHGPGRLDSPLKIFAIAVLTVLVEKRVGRVQASAVEGHRRAGPNPIRRTGRTNQ